MPRKSTKRLDLAECRELLDPEGVFGDDALLEFRERSYDLIALLAAAYRQPAGLEGTSSQLSSDERVEVEERAAIHEFEGKLTRKQSEKLALTTHMNSKSRH